MCTRVRCSKCGLPGWVGCGAHVEQVLGDVPKDQRCRCRERRKPTHGPQGASWWRKLLGR